MIGKYGGFGDILLIIPKYFDEKGLFKGLGFVKGVCQGFLGEKKVNGWRVGVS